MVQLNKILNFPKEIIDIIKQYFNYIIMKNLTRKSNELKIAYTRTQTPSAHAIHLMIERFNFRYLPNSRFKTTTNFINDTLKFHKLWTGPSVEFPIWYKILHQKEKSGIFLHGQPC